MYEIYDEEVEQQIQIFRQLRKWTDLYQFCKNKTSLLCQVYKSEALLKLKQNEEGRKILQSLVNKDIEKIQNSKEVFLIAKCFDLLEHEDQIKWYEKAAKLGEFVAQHNLGKNKKKH
jgi:hypothetical protein